MRLSIFCILIWLFFAETVFASRSYDPFEGGKIICHQVDKTSELNKEYFFRSDFSSAIADKQTKFKPTQIQLMTALFKEEGLLFRTRKLTGTEDFNFYSALGNQIILCGENLSESDIAGCSYKGGDDNSASPEMMYIINCGQWRLQIEGFENNQVRVECTGPSGKVIQSQKFLSCIRSH